MAAPTTSYYTESIRLKNNTNTQEVRRAKYMANTSPDSSDGYFNANDSDEVKKSKIMAIFSLDKLLCSEKNGIKAFTGLIKINSSNAKYHNINRKSNIRVSNGSDIYAVMNDGGLNTLGKCGVYSVLSNSAPDKDSLYDNYPPRITDTIVFYSFNSSFYSDSTVCKVFIQDENISNDWIEIYSGTLSKKLSLIDKTDIIPYINKSGNHYFKTSITNEEGTLVSDIIAVFIKMSYATFKYSSTSASEAKESGSNVSRYYNTRELLDAENNGSNATQMFKDETSNPEHTENGFYVLNSYWYKYGYDTLTDRYSILQKGLAEAGGYPVGDSGNIITTNEGISYNGYDKDEQSVANLEVNSNNYESGVIFKQIIANYETNPITETIKFYTDDTFTTYASQGYYSIGEYVNGVTREISVSGNGDMIYDNNLI